MEDQVVWIEKLFHGIRDDLHAGLSNRIAAVEDAFKAEFQHIRQRQADLARAVNHLIIKEADMSALTDSLTSIASDISSAVGDNASKTETLIGYKDENDSALSGAVTSLTSARDALKDTGSKLDAAIAAHNAAGQSTDTGTQQPASNSSTDSSGASASAPVVSTSTTPSGASVTTTVDQSAGTTEAVKTDPSTGVSSTTVLNHADGSATTTDASGATIDTDGEAHQAAVQAAQAAGVNVPSA